MDDIGPAASITSNSRVLVIDNGSGYCKAGFVGELSPRQSIPNAIACSRKQGSNQVVGDVSSIRQLENATSGGYTLRRPVHAGVLIDHEAQCVIWTHIIQNLMLQCKDLSDMSDLDLVITESFNIPPAVYKDLQEILYEEFKIKSCVVLQSQIVMTHAFPQSIPSDVATNTDGYPDMISMTDNNSVSSFHYNPYTANFFPRTTLTNHDNSLEYKLIQMEPQTPGEYHAQVGCSAAFRKVVDSSRLAVDIGYSGCWAAPQYDNVALDFAVNRNFTGAHSLDRELKRLICFRKVRIEHSDLLIEQIRKACCETCSDPTDYSNLLQRAKEASHFHHVNVDNGEDRFSSLPISIYDLETDSVIDHGSIGMDFRGGLGQFQSSNDTINKVVLGPERFSVIESLFHPDESFSEPVRVRNGVNKPTASATSEWTTRLIPNNIPTFSIRRPMGIPDLIHKSIFDCPPILQRAMTQSIVLGGGLINTPNLVKRIASELRAQTPSAWPLQIVHLAEKPEHTTWIGAAVWASHHYSEAAVRREDYLEGKTRHS